MHPSKVCSVSGGQASDGALDNSGWNHVVWGGVPSGRTIRNHGHPSGYLADSQPGGDSIGHQ
eukprot:7180276-Prorocentrum_lima.AAC.1